MCGGKGYTGHLFNLPLNLSALKKLKLKFLSAHHPYNIFSPNTFMVLFFLYLHLLT